MKLEKDAVTIGGFIIIFLLILLIIMPPVLRLMFGKDDNNNSKNMESTTISKLECHKKEENNNYSISKKINTIYNGNAINKITFNYEVTFKNEGITLADVYIYEYEMLKTTPNANVSSSVNSHVVELDFTNNNYGYDEFLNKYSRDISSEKSYYESNDYICSVVR